MSHDLIEHRKISNTIVNHSIEHINSLNQTTILAEEKNQYSNW